MKLISIAIIYYAYFYIFFLFLKKGLEGNMKVNGIQVKLFYIKQMKQLMKWCEYNINQKKDMIFIIGKG